MNLWPMLLRREMREFFGRPGPFVGLFVLVAASSAALLIDWPAGSTSRGGGQRVLLAFHDYELALTIVVLAVVTAGTVVEERRRGTWEPLILTPASPLAILFAKAAPRLLWTLLAIVAVMPVAAALVLLGGVDLSRLLLSQGVILAAAAFMTAITLASALRARSFLSATLRALGIFLASNAALRPFGAIRAAYLTDISLASFEPGLGALWIYFPLSTIATILLVCATATESALRAESTQALDRTVSGSQPLYTEPQRRASRWDARAKTALQRLWSPAVYQRERVTEPRYLLAARLVLFCIGVPLGLVASARVAFEAALILSVLASFVAVLQATRSTGREFARGTLDLLRTSLITPRSLALGHWLAALRYPIWAAVCFAPTLVLRLGTAQRSVSLAEIVGPIGTVLTAGGFASALGVAIATITRSTRSAVVWTLIVIALSYRLLPPLGATAFPRALVEVAGTVACLVLATHRFASQSLLEPRTPADTSDGGEPARVRRVR